MTDLHDGADLRDRIDRAMTDLHAPEGLTPAVLTEGHRLRRRRRIVTAGSGVAAAAVVAALVVPGLSGGTSGTSPEIATQPPASPSLDEPSVDEPNVDKPSGGMETPSLGPDGGSPFPEPPAGWWDLPSEEMATLLEALLPEGVSATEVVTESDDGAPGEDPVTAGWLHATLEGDAGPGGFEIILYPPELDKVPDSVTTTDANGVEHTDVFAQGPGYQSRISCPGNLIRPDRCIEITGDDGVHSGRTSVTTTAGITVHEVVLLEPDGGLVYFATSNSTDPKWGRGSTASATVPPLSLDQLRTLAEDPAWTSYRP